MKTEVACDVCGKQMRSENSFYDVGSERDLCAEHGREAMLGEAKRERAALAAWLESTHLQKLRDLDARIVELERPNI
jgi:predicted nucleic acid-binding Zn ribbon protein